MRPADVPRPWVGVGLVRVVWTGPILADSLMTSQNLSVQATHLQPRESSMRTRFLLLLPTLLLSACSVYFSSTRVEGNGQATSEQRDLRGFDEIDCTGSMDLTVVQSAEFQVVIRGESNLLEYIEASVRGNSLDLAPRDGYSPDPMPSVEIHMPVCKLLDRTGSGDTEMKGLNAKKLELDLTGSGDLSAEGAVEDVALDRTGSGDVNLEGLVADSMEVDLIGSGTTRVRVEGKLSGSITGSGKVHLSGDAREAVDITGSGRVIRVETGSGGGE
ncbi:hypothetical protein CMO84_04290 [Candidatus Woesearchaeota archaeon]|nr:hypothetical protein [Candidatus Woesearchaeota archaeon]